MSKADDIWAKVIEMMRMHLTDVTISTFFSDTRAVDLTDNSIVVDAGNVVARDVIMSHYIGLVEECLSELFSIPYGCKLLVGEDEIAAYTANKAGDPNFLTTNEFTFETFVVGSSNRFAHAAAMAVANEPAVSYNPLFIHGGPGLGKTHLLYAIAHALRQKRPAAKIVYIKGDEFTNELIAAIRAGKNMEFREKYRGADLFLVDDIQFIAGKDSTQEEFFHTFNTLYEAGKQIVLTSDRPPKEMVRLEDRLRSRFEWGLIADIQPPDLETRVAIIRNKASSVGLDISDAAVMFMAENITANVRQIEGVVKKIQAFNRLLGEPVDVDTVAKAIKDIFVESPGMNPTPDIIIEETEKYYSLEPGTIVSSSRGKQTAQARHVAAYLARNLTKLSLPDLGAAFGRHHTTIMHSIEIIEAQRKSDQVLDSDLKDITFNVKNR